MLTALTRRSTFVEVNDNDVDAGSTVAMKSAATGSPLVPDTTSYGVGTTKAPNNKVVVGMMYATRPRRTVTTSCSHWMTATVRTALATRLTSSLMLVNLRMLPIV